MDPFRDLVMMVIGFLGALLLSKVWPQEKKQEVREKKQEVRAVPQGIVKEDAVAVYLYKTSELLHTKACSKARVNRHAHWTDEGYGVCACFMKS